ncbi:MAG: hypothetical protein LBD46_00930 [Endomicrobium sp.]|jgi:hypothetical protein|nr:hypothetical protein [Endomicrobium sp.]
MRILFAVLFFLISALHLYAADKLVFDNYGFSIDKLTFSEKETPENFQAIIMFLPGDVTFTPNVNVQKQRFAATADEYVKLSIEQFEDFGMRLIEKKQNEKFATFEYTASMGGKDLHFYAKAIFSKGYVYLVTGTALVSQWDKVGKILKKNVDSLEVLK